MLTRNEYRTLKKDAYKIIVGLIGLYMSEGNPEPETVSELTGREYTPEMCKDLWFYLHILMNKFSEKGWKQ